MTQPTMIAADHIRPFRLSLSYNGVMKTTCSVSGCDRPSRWTTYCNAHLARLQRTGDVMADKPIRPTPKVHERANIAARILAQTITTNTGCIEWTGLRDQAGYGRISWQGYGWRTHRAIWTYVVGDIPIDKAPDGSAWTLDHLCGNRLCVNIDHLELISRIENSRRAGGIPKANDVHRAKVAAKGDPPHGNIQRYHRLRCRCDLCRAANATAQRIRRAKKRQTEKV